MRDLLFAAAIFFASPVLAQPAATTGTMEHEDGSAELKTAEDWFDCSGFLLNLAAGGMDRGADMKKMISIMMLKRVAQVKGEKLAAGSNENPTEADLAKYVHRQIKPIEEFRRKHHEIMQKGDEESRAHAERYLNRCMGPTVELASQIDAVAPMVPKLGEPSAQ